MAKYRNLRSMDSVNLVLFQPGMGGQLVSNLFNLADPGFIKSDIKEHYRSIMFVPVGSGYHDEEMTLNFHSGKWFFRFINSRSPDDDIDLWLNDIEIHMVKTKASHGSPVNDGLYQGSVEDEQYYLYGRPTTRHRRIYLPYHVPDDEDTAAALSHVSGYARRFGISMRYILVTTESEPVKTWAYRRAHDIGIVPLESYDDYRRRYDRCHLRVLAHPDSTSIGMDDLAYGRIDSFVDRMGTIIGGMENVDIVKDRLASYRINKMQGMIAGGNK